MPTHRYDGLLLLHELVQLFFADDPYAASPPQQVYDHARYYDGDAVSE